MHTKHFVLRFCWLLYCASFIVYKFMLQFSTYNIKNIYFIIALVLGFKELLTMFILI